MLTFTARTVTPMEVLLVQVVVGAQMAAVTLMVARHRQRH